MSLVPRNKLFNLDSFFEPDLFNSLWPATAEMKNLSTFAPRVDIKEKGNNYEITAELPGVKKEDIHINLENGMLSFQAETKQETKEEEDGKVIRQERRYGTFYRSFDVGNLVQENDIHAEFNDGVLKIVAPKIQEEKTQTRKISIR